LAYAECATQWLRVSTGWASPTAARRFWSPPTTSSRSTPCEAPCRRLRVVARSRHEGINVWCAAGKGTLGTDAVVSGVEQSGLRQLVEHRTLVLPQLSATGVAAHDVKRATGFLVRFGPVSARDIPEYLAAGMQATPAMRRVRFGWRERLVVAPMELVNARGAALVILARSPYSISFSIED